MKSSSLRQPRRLFSAGRPVHDVGSPKGFEQSPKFSAPAAIQAPERTLESDRNDLASNRLSNGSTTDTPSTTVPVHVEWFNKNKELWIEASTPEELMEAIETETDRFVVVDFYAGWCSSCKAAYPALCKIAGNMEFNKNFKFVKANVQEKDVAMYIRSQGVKGIPTIIVFAPGGEKVAHFGASFRKINMVKANLTVINANRGAEFSADPEGYVFPRPGSN